MLIVLIMLFILILSACPGRSEICGRCYGIHPAEGFFAALDLAAEINASWYGFPIEWAHVERDRGTYRWGIWDQRVNNVTEKGLEPIVTIFGVPKWASSDPKCYEEKGRVECPDNTYRDYPPKPEYYHDYEKYVRALVNRYKDRVRYWKVQHELTDHWDVDPATCRENEDRRACEMRQMVEMLSHAYRAIKEADPNAIVLSPSHGHSRRWEEEAVNYTREFLSHGACDYFDMWDVHYYDRVEDVDWAIQSLRNALSEYNCYKDFWETETGYTSDDDIALFGDEGGNGWCNSDLLGPGERFQAKDLEEKLRRLVELGVKGVGLIRFYDIKRGDYKWPSESGYPRFEFHCKLGVYEGEELIPRKKFRKIRPKLGFCAYQKVVLGRVEEPWCNLYEGLVFADSFYAIREIDLNNGFYSGISLVEGRYNKAVMINDSDYLYYPVNGNFNKTEGTIEFWVRTNWDPATSDKHHFLFSENPGTEWNSPNHVYVYFHKSQSLNFVIFDENGEGHTVSVPITWNPKEWHHVAVTWKLSDSGESEMRLYVDGILRDDTPTNPGSFTLSEVSENFFVGTSYNRVYQLDGMVDEFRMYNKARRNPHSESFFIFRCGDDSCNPEESFISCPTDCNADLNKDGDVDIHDMSIVATHFGLRESHPDWNEIADVVENGEIDVYDLVFVASRFT